MPMRMTVLSCAGCGSSLDFIVGLPSAECPYCGQTMRVDSGSTDAGEAPIFNAIIPLSHDRASFADKVLEFLADGEDTPDDLLIAFEVDQDLHAVFAPYQRYKLSFDGSMTCDAGHEVVNYVKVLRNDKWVDEKKTDIAWAPFSAPVKGRLTIDVCLAEGIDEALLQRLQDVTSYQKLSRFEPQLVSNHALQHAIPQVEGDEVFTARGYGSLASYVSGKGRDIAPGINRNVTTQFSYSVEEQIPFLAGIWIQSYQYRGVRYQVVMDGGSGKVFGYRPTDDERISWLNDLQRLGHYSWFAGLVCLLIALFMESGLALLIGAAVVGGGYLVSRTLQRRVGETSAEFRRGLLEAVRAQGRGGDVSSPTRVAENRYAQLRKVERWIPRVYAGAAVVALLMAGVGSLSSSDEAVGPAVAESASVAEAPPSPESAEAPLTEIPSTEIPEEASAGVEAIEGLYVEIRNNTGYVLTGVYISPDTADSWEENVIEGQALGDGESRRINLNGYSSPIFDIRLVDSDGDTYTFSDIDVSQFNITATPANLDPRG